MRVVTGCSLQVLYQAKLLGVPKDVIERNMKKATDKDQADFTEVRTYPGGDMSDMRRISGQSWGSHKRPKDDGGLDV